MEGHQKFPPSVSVVTAKEWDLLQTYNHSTLLCTVALRGTGGVWRAAVADITAEVKDMQHLIGNLARVKQTVALNTHATVLLMPQASQAVMKRTLEAHPLITNEALVGEV